MERHTRNSLSEFKLIINRGLASRCVALNTHALFSTPLVVALIAALVAVLNHLHLASPPHPVPRDGHAPPRSTCAQYLQDVTGKWDSVAGARLLILSPPRSPTLDTIIITAAADAKSHAAASLPPPLGSNEVQKKPRKVVMSSDSARSETAREDWSVPRFVAIDSSPQMVAACHTPPFPNLLP